IFCSETGIGAFGPGQRQFQLAAVNGIFQRPAPLDTSLDMHIRVSAREAAQKKKKTRLSEIRQQPDAYLSFQRRVPHRRDRLVIELEQTPREAEDDLAFRREGEASPALAQQRPAGGLLELAQLQTDRRLRAPKPVGSLGVAAEVMPRYEGPQHVEIKGDWRCHRAGSPK